MKKLKLSILLLLLLGSWTSAHAILITTTSGDTYDITTVSGQLDGPTSILDNLDDLDWFGDETLATELAGLVSNQLGLVNFGLGPYFLHAIDNTSWFAETWLPPNGPVIPATNLLEGNSQRTWATGALVTAVPEPTTLALMGLGIAGLGFRRKTK